VQKAYNAAQAEIGEQGMKLSKAEYYEYIAELAGHLESLQDCNDEERRQEESQ